MLSKLLLSRRLALVAGLSLVLVPTLFSVFPEWTSWPQAVRWLVLVAWAATAVVVVTATVRQSGQLEDLVGKPRVRRDEARAAAAQTLLHAVMRPEFANLPDHFELRLFLPDDNGTLLPEFESPGSTPSHGWRPGHGATGMAWASDSMVVAEGASISDATYGLTPDQQKRYRDLTVVAATPVQNARGRSLGVLAASSAEDDGTFASPEARLDLAALAEVVRVCCSTSGGWAAIESTGTGRYSLDMARRSRTLKSTKSTARTGVTKHRVTPHEVRQGLKRAIARDGRYVRAGGPLDASASDRGK